MRMNRRNVLIGLGTIVAGGGAALGTGAFSTVTAERTVSVETAGDASAFLALTAAPGAEDYVTENGTLEIDIGGNDGDGINQNALTTFDELVQIENQGTNTVETITVTIQGDNGEEELLSLVEDFDGDTPLDETEITTFGLEIELREDQLPDPLPNAYDDGDLDASFDPTIEIVAETESGN
ncbi:hypothetical protein [Natrialba sp. INN-245]|uniref:hypothetical protein n=1 Tax=Natrialba sp. INN-245 TaxID=2690967 RepID=UPI00130FC6CD|nr:hypothetical protein [Natrialba sp. INN-245]MWV40341.1 hypothetical protein [Natrialba sp. INN-245]